MAGPACDEKQRRGLVDSAFLMRATAAPVEGNRVRLSVEVDESEVDEALDCHGPTPGHARCVSPASGPARSRARSSKRDSAERTALRQQAMSDALPDLYARAVVDTEVDPIAAPEIDITSGEDGGPGDIRRRSSRSDPRCPSPVTAVWW